MGAFAVASTTIVAVACQGVGAVHVDDTVLASDQYTR